jgi:sarcosine oxidase, subunit alpha
MLLRRKELGTRTRLVGFHLPIDSLQLGRSFSARLLEGCQVVEQGRPVGRVTSSRYSPSLNQYIGLAWVPDASTAIGNRFTIHTNEADIDAVVTALPFYDLEGLRVKG